MGHTLQSVPSANADFKAVAAGIGVGLAVGSVSGLWVVALVLGIVVGATMIDRERRRA